MTEDNVSFGRLVPMLTTDDLDGTIAFYRASLWESLKEQAPVAFPLCETDYGMREFGIRDPNGFMLSFGKETGTRDPVAAS